jgi:hypothetical protein
MSRVTRHSFSSAPGRMARVSGEERLPQGRSGTKVWRSSRGVHRTTGPWTPTVHAFLRHLEAVGFGGAPRVLGMDDDGRELVSFIDGDVLADPEWQPGHPTPWPEWAQPEECLVESARLVRGLHDASRTFVLPDDAVWRQHACPVLGRGEIVCHGDVGPHNTVYRRGMPVAFIDWDAIRPNHPLVEFGNAAWHYVPLGDDAYFGESGFRARPDLAARLEVFAREYGVTDRSEVAWALHQARQRSVEAAKYWPISPAEGAAALRQIATDLDWLHDNVEGLVCKLD